MGATAISGSLVRLVDATLEEAERRNALLRFREDNGLGIKLVKREHLLQVLERSDMETTSVVLDEQLLEIIKAFWSCIIDPEMRTGSILSHHLDLLHNEIKLSSAIGIKAIGFIQEQYDPPEVLLDFYFNHEKREGVEALINKLGELVFLDPDINNLWPLSIRRIIQASALAYYLALVCPGVCRESTIKDDGQQKHVEKVNKKGKKRKIISFRRAHLRTLPDGYVASAKQLALAISSGKYSEEEIDGIIQEGKHQTFVSEFSRDSSDLPAIDPRRLFNRISPIKFLNAYLDLTGG